MGTVTPEPPDFAEKVQDLLDFFAGVSSIAFSIGLTLFSQAIPTETIEEALRTHNYRKDVVANMLVERHLS